jgi:uridylate kinase
MRKSIVVKIGGSILYDHLINFDFDMLRKVKNWYWDIKASYDTIVLVTGGGKLSRSIEEKIAGSVSGENSIHNVAMLLTQTNAAIIAGFLEDDDIYIPKKLGDAYEYLIMDGGKTMVSGGLKVGWSTDMDAAVFADVLEAGRVHKISNIDYVYNKDPKEFFDARPIKDMSWNEYFKMFSVVPGQQHEANAHIPVDVQCSQFCSRKNLSFHITGGKLLEERENIADVLNDGTFLHP